MLTGAGEVLKSFPRSANILHTVEPIPCKWLCYSLSMDSTQAESLKCHHRTSRNKCSWNKHDYNVAGKSCKYLPIQITMAINIVYCGPLSLVNISNDVIFITGHFLWDKWSTTPRLTRQKSDNCCQPIISMQQSVDQFF